MFRCQITSAIVAFWRDICRRRKKEVRETGFVVSKENGDFKRWEERKTFRSFPLFYLRLMYTSELLLLLLALWAWRVSKLYFIRRCALLAPTRDAHLGNGNFLRPFLENTLLFVFNTWRTSIASTYPITNIKDKRIFYIVSFNIYEI